MFQCVNSDCGACLNRRFYYVLFTAFLSCLLFGCAASETFNPGAEIVLVSREDGSGTRGAFVDVTGIRAEDSNGQTVDLTSIEAIIANGTNIVMTIVAQNPYAIGYISLGSLNGTVKALDIDGTEISVETIQSGDYRLSRPFIAATRSDVSPAARDFLNFIRSGAGREVIQNAKYVAVSDSAYEVTNGLSGKVVIGGSSSVSPVMEKLKEAYRVLNPGVEIEIQQSDSTTGMLNAAEGILDIGMASRPLKDSEKEALFPIEIAHDGIAVIVNRENPLESVSFDQVKAIFEGLALTWDDVSVAPPR